MARNFRIDSLCSLSQASCDTHYSADIRDVHGGAAAINFQPQWTSLTDIFPYFRTLLIFFRMPIDFQLLGHASNYM